MVSISAVLVETPEAALVTHTSARWTPAADVITVVKFESWLTGAGLSIAHTIADDTAGGLAWTLEDETLVTTVFGGNESRGSIWSASAGSSPVEMEIDLVSHASVAAEAGWSVYEISDGDPADVFAQIDALIIGNSGTNATSGLSITSNTLGSAPTSGLVVAMFGLEHNVQGSPAPTFDTPPTDWSEVTSSKDETQWWMQQLLETSTAKTSITHGMTGNTILQNRVVTIAEINVAPTVGGGGILRPKLSASQRHLLTR